MRPGGIKWLSQDHTMEIEGVLNSKLGLRDSESHAPNS